jgi:hypothetical protein
MCTEHMPPPSIPDDPEIRAELAAEIRAILLALGEA